ncbi:MAG: RNA polymerase sporulation sigma factor SigG [Clostridia bacterium]|nr:RNA polymerase sporulation sigma factor SigG [Clostridia bacterium]
MINKVEICGANTSELPLMKESEKTALLERIRQGDASARDKLICGNLRLVLSVIQRFTNRGENPDDLFQVGCIGLIKAIDNFDPVHGVCFSTYAVPMIIGEVRRHLRDNSAVRVSRSIRDTAYRALRAKEELLTKLGRDPSVTELAEKMGIPCEEVVIAMEAIVDPLSFSEPIYNDGGDAILVMDQISSPRDSDENWIEEIMLKDAIKNLSPRERHILSLRYIKGRTQTEVAAEIGISQAQVSRLEKSALNEIKKQL